MARRNHTDVKERVLLALKASYPRGIDSLDLITMFGPCAKQKARSLVWDGWDIVTDEDSATCATYRLRSLVKGNPIVVDAGMTIKHQDGTWEARTFGHAVSAGKVPPEALELALSAACAVYRSILDPYLSPTPPTLAPPKPLDPIAISKQARLDAMFEEIK